MITTLYLISFIQSSHSIISRLIFSVSLSFKVVSQTVVDTPVNRLFQQTQKAHLTSKYGSHPITLFGPPVKWRFINQVCHGLCPFGAYCVHDWCSVSRSYAMECYRFQHGRTPIFAHGTYLLVTIPVYSTSIKSESCFISQFADVDRLQPHTTTTAPTIIIQFPEV